MLSSGKELLERVRNTNAPLAQRLAAMEQICNQDDIFYLFFKPGEDRNLQIRIAAVQKLTEVDILKILDKKVEIPELKKAIEERLAAVYADEKDRKSPSDATVPVNYARRLKSRTR